MPIRGVKTPLPRPVSPHLPARGGDKPAVTDPPVLAADRNSVCRYAKKNRFDACNLSVVVYPYAVTGNLQNETRMRVLLPLLAVGLFLALAACAKQQPAISPPYAMAVDIRQTMDFIIDPAADRIWDSAGSIITADGEQDLAPATPEDWATVEAAAAVLAESGNLLMMPGRSAGPDWNEHAGHLIVAGKQAMTAAHQQDADALFDAGGEIYQACLACHNQYLVADGAP